MDGLIFDVHRGTTHDGPGMRTSIFLKGCPLHCAWCHNPESMAFAPEVEWNEQKCIGCNHCKATCSQKEITEKANYTPLDVIHAENAIECAQRCPSKALRTIGERKTVDEIIKIATKDMLYFEAFSGGVTFSGGEPLAQVDLLEEVLPKLKEKGINIAIDTCGNVPYHSFERVLPFVDAFLYDVKLYDSEAHRKFTGVTNELIFDNLRRLAADLKPTQKLWIRTPLIPDATATVQNIHDICNFIKDFPALERYELCAFNNVCRDKYRKLGLDWAYNHTPLMTQIEAEQYFQIAQKYLHEKAVLSGLTANDERVLVICDP